MQNGFVYPIAKRLVVVLKALNAVEYVKDFSAWLYCKAKGHDLSDNELIAAKNLGIDLFLVSKWALVIWFIAFGVTGGVAEVVVFYLIATNLFSYFYYHVWGSAYRARADLDSQRRRFVNFILSIGFYIVCYSYLYQFQFASHIQWPDHVVDWVNALYLSVANAFTLTYGGFQPLSQTARVLFMTELVNTFFFFTIIVANALPALQNREP